MARNSVIARVILIVGGLGYAALCAPAIQRSGREPFDPFWTAVTYVWIAPVCLSAVFEPKSAPGRRRWLLIYALVTAFFNSGTGMDMVPRRMDLGVMLVYAVLMFGPFHLFVTFGVELLLQWVLRRTPRRSAPGYEPSPILRSSLLAGLIGCVTIGAAVGFPIAYRTSKLDAERAQGVAMADADWQAGTAGLHSNGDYIILDDIVIDYFVDLETGLTRLRRSMRDIGYAAAYDARVRELIRNHGLPAWNVKAELPDIPRLIDLLDAEDLVEVTEFPYQLTPKVVLIRGGSVTFGNSTYGGPDGTVCTVSELGGLSCSGDGDQPVYVKNNGKTLLLHFIRGGNESLDVLDAHGRQLASVYRPRW